MAQASAAAVHAAEHAPAAPPEHVPEVTIPFETAALGGTVSLNVDDQHIDLKIPPGMSAGQTMRLAGQGPSGDDLYIKIRVGNHAYFQREGNDIILEVPLSVTEAALGATVEVPTLDGSRWASRCRRARRAVHGSVCAERASRAAISTFRSRL